jgi:hypothetical protein
MVQSLTMKCLRRLQDLAASDGLYRIRVSKGSDDTAVNFVYSFLKAVS